MIPLKLPNAAASTITVSTTAGTLRSFIETAASEVVTNWEKSLNAVILSVEGTAGTNDIRVLFDGNTPTGAAGLLLKAGAQYSFYGIDLDKFMLIRDLAADATVSVQIGYATESKR